MARPVANYQDLFDQMFVRFWRNVKVGGPNECWPHEGQYHYTVKRSDRYRPATLAWIARFGRETLPPDMRIAYIGQKETCTVKECVNADHLEIKHNSAAGKVGGERRRVQSATAKALRQLGNQPMAKLKEGQVWQDVTDADGNIINRKAIWPNTPEGRAFKAAHDAEEDRKFRERLAEMK